MIIPVYCLQRFQFLLYPFLLPVFLNLELRASVDASPLPTNLLVSVYILLSLAHLSTSLAGLVSRFNLKIVWISGLNSKTRWYRRHKCS